MLGDGTGGLHSSASAGSSAVNLHRRLDLVPRVGGIGFPGFRSWAGELSSFLLG